MGSTPCGHHVPSCRYQFHKLVQEQAAHTAVVRGDEYPQTCILIRADLPLPVKRDDTFDAGLVVCAV